MKSAYSDSEIKQAEQYSAAISRYSQLISSKTAIPDQIESRLRYQRNFEWREAALATFYSRGSTATIAKNWSQATDSIVLEAWRESGSEDKNLILIAMGKLGAQELNLSSDIDLIVLSPTAPDKYSQKCLNHFRSLLNDITEDGFCYRVDLDLRPGGRSGPLISSLKQFEDYLWTQAELWERLAYVRMRILSAKEEHKAEVENLVSRFVYRKFLDFAILEEFKNLRNRIKHEYSHTPTPQHWNLKHSPGGIRDIELFIHSLQVMHGGRLASLRTFSTDNALDSIIKNEVFNPSDCDFVRNSYWQLRDIEHWMQMKDDLQTYEWKSSTNSPTHVQKLSEENLSRRTKNLKIIESLLGKLDKESNAQSDPSALIDYLSKLNIPNFNAADYLTRFSEVKSTGRNPSTDKLRREQILTDFASALPDPQIKGNLALESLLEFLLKSRTHGGLLDLLTSQPLLTKDLAVLFGSSPYLGKIIIDRPELLDSFLYRMTEASPSDEQDFLEKVFERRLLNEIIAGIEFVKTQSLEALFEAQTKTADKISLEILSRINLQHNSDLEILALGKWGGSELGFKSDLDFIFIKYSPPTENDFKVAKRFVSRISEPHRGGAIYEIDLRLRPSGKAGPLIVTHEQAVDYFTNKAAAWERQSYLLSRVIGQQDATIVKSIREALILRSLSQEDLTELLRIREQLLKPTEEDFVDIKFNPGGLVDIELSLQSLTLQGRIQPTAGGTLKSLLLLSQLKPKDFKSLFVNYSKLKLTEQFLRLVSGFKETRVLPKALAYPQLCVLMNDDNLLQSLKELLKENLKLLKHLA
jgi:glutamate-ammonia-ligase adenylyltransferase